MISVTSITRFGAASVLAACIAAAGCDEKLSDVTGPTPDLAPNFGSIEQAILLSTDSSGRAACVNCHTGRIPGISLNFSAGQDGYAQLVNAPSRQRPELMLVSPGDPENSYLLHKLEGRSTIVGLRMPRNGPPHLTAGQLSVIRRWIEIGAPR